MKGLMNNKRTIKSPDRRLRNDLEGLLDSTYEYNYDRDPSRYDWDDLFPVVDFNEGYANLCNQEYAQLIGAEWDSPDKSRRHNGINIYIVEDKFDGGSSVHGLFIFKGMKHETIEGYYEHIKKRSKEFERLEKLEKTGL